MSPEKQRIAIAEACGFSRFHTEREWEEKAGPDGYEGTYDVLRADCGDESDVRVPDYVNDLNAMHEAEKLLTWSRDSLDGTAGAYASELADILYRDNAARRESTQSLGPAACCYQWHATAAQRAEALLRTLGKWEDDA